MLWLHPDFLADIRGNCIVFMVTSHQYVSSCRAVAHVLARPYRLLTLSTTIEVDFPRISRGRS
nr:MAG TPA: hypothetical protein [Caudoviricetes sp.]